MSLVFRAAPSSALLRRCAPLRDVLVHGRGGDVAGDESLHFIIKMVNNLRQDDDRRPISRSSHLRREHGVEYELPLRLPPHPGVVMVLHHYAGSTAAFSHHLGLIMPAFLPVSMASRTTFMVMPEYRTSLQRWLRGRRRERDDVADVSEDEWRLIVVQALDILTLLQAHFIAHRDIKVRFACGHGGLV